MPVPSDPYAALISWLETEHEGFHSDLVCRNVPGAGRGMFVARDIAGGETLLEIPSSALLNPLTLRNSTSNTIPAHLFPLTTSDRVVGPASKRRRQSLTATRLDTTQLLTLHLLLSRDPAGRHPSLWSTYLATLPSFDDWHPLTWFHAAEGGRDRADWQALLGCLTVEAREKLEDVRGRYMADCEVLRGILRVEEPFVEQNILSYLNETDFLWAWLNINTRTVSIPLDIPGNPSLMNHTLVPVLDMLNHTSCSSAQIPHPRQFPSSSSISSHTRSKLPSTTPGAPRPRISSREVGPLIPGKIGFRLVAPHKGLRAGDEVLFEYGSHSSATLFAEYGFVEGPYDSLGASEGGIEWEKRKGAMKGQSGGWLDKEHGSVDLGDLVKELWNDKGMSDEERLEKEDTLTALSCMTRHVIHTTPSPPHPSHSLLMILRVLHLPAHSPKLDPIKTGRVCFVSQPNETAVLSSLKQIGTSASSRAMKGVRKVRATERAHATPNSFRDGRVKNGRCHVEPSSSSALGRLDKGVWKGLEGMWQEELEVVSAVLKRIERGETDW